MIQYIRSRDKKNRKQEEDWKWFEDPYKSDASSVGWTRSVLESHGSSVPAPSAPYGTEPPVHTGARVI